MADKSPAFQFYPKDFLTDVKQISMSLAEAGAYWRLCCHCWLSGSLPMDMRQLARLCGATSRQMREMWPAIGPCFQERDGVLVHKRLELERQKQDAYRKRQSDAAAMRWQCHGNAEPMPEACSSSPSSSPSPEKHIAPPSNLSVSDEIAEKAGRFLERYPQIYAEERNGAHFRVKPVMHFMPACELVEGWPDEKRLELMFRLFDKFSRDVP